MNGVTLALKKEQLIELKKQIAMLSMPQDKQKRLMWRLAKNGMIKNAVRKIKAQISVEDKPFAKRRSKQKRKLLSKIMKRAVISQKTHDSATIYFKGFYKSSKNKTVNVGVLAAQNDGGKTINMNKNMLHTDPKIQKGKPTKAAIKKLRELGYTIPNTNKKAPKKRIEENLTHGVAGGIIRMMTRAKGQKRKWGKWSKTPAAWEIKIPARHFFGYSDEDYTRDLLRELNAINHGWDVKKQDMKTK